MPQVPADELFDLAPDARLETFFGHMSLEVGDPEQHCWVEKNAVKFYAYYRSWLKTDTRHDGPIAEYPDAPTALLQYFVWYSDAKAHHAMLDACEQEGP